MVLRRSRDSGPVRRSWPRSGRAERRIGVTGQAAGRTEKGAAREDNQDRYAIGTGVFVVADGVGGHPGGAHAAECVARHAVRLAQRMQRALARSRRSPRRELLAEIPARCQALLRDEAAHHPELAGMATTLVLAVVAWPYAHVVNAGDSRCYLFRGGRLTQVTTDQTVAAELAAGGAIRSDDVSRSPMRNVLSTSITSGPHDVRPELRCVELREGDWLLLTTDGLHESLAEAAMAAVLSAAPTPEVGCGGLIEAARAAGASDDATAVAVRLDGRRSG
jgi:protein phosphatase